MLIPNVRLMAKAIENHVALHMQKKGDSELEADQIRDLLNAQVLQKASESGN